MAPVVKNPFSNAGDIRLGFDLWVRKGPWRRGWQPTPVFLPGRIPMYRGAWRATVHRASRVRHV